MKEFYGTLFGWTFVDYGEDYASFSDSNMNGGFNADASHRTKAPLAVIETDDIAALEKQVQQAGGKVTMPTFSYPGGRRFHFTDPSGNELAVMQND
jgi:predicted enzyme related to lactoylglutathione lyase